MLDAILNFISAGLLDLSIGQLALVTLVLVQITIAAVTLYLHHSQAHRGVDLHPVVSHFFRFWLWMTTGMVTREWVSIHRKHHAKCETEEDPHSPQIAGIGKILLDGADPYRREAENTETLEKYGHGTPNDWIERKLYTPHKYLGIGLMLILDVILFGALGLTVWAIQMAWIPFWAAGVINGAGHYWGYRNFQPADASTNLIPWAFWIGGEELHNNHHAFPSSAKFSVKWWEFDIGWLYLRGLSALGLARVKKVAPRPVIEPGKQRIDLDTLKAVFTNRLHVMANYTRHVTLPVLRAQRRSAGIACRHTYRRLKALMTRDRSQIDDREQRELEAALSGSEQLKTVYQFRLQLQQVWDRAASSHEHLVQALKDWCAQAEASGIKALADFAAHLRGYSLQSGTATA